MIEPDCGRSRDLERVRELLFPNLPTGEGWARIDAAIAGASDPERWASVEQAAVEEQLDEALVEQVKDALRGTRAGSNGA